MYPDLLGLKSVAGCDDFNAGDPAACRRKPSVAAAGRAETIGAALERAADLDQGGLRLLDRHEAASWYPWAEVARRAQQIALRLLAQGVSPGDRVAMIYPTDIGFFDAFFGTLLAGGVPAPLYPPVRLGRLDEYHERTAAMLIAAGARLLLAHPRVRRLLGSTVAAAARHGRQIIALTEADLPVPGDGPLPQVAPDALALLQFSSGTTLAPKPVALTHRALQAQSQALESFFPPDDTVTHAGVSWLPLYHDMGLIGCVLPALNRPAELTLLGPEVFVARPATWLRAISRYKATVSPAPNFAYALCVERVRDEELNGVDLSSWRLALDGAEPVAPRVLRAFGERFAAWGLRPEALTPVYGLSEAALAVTFSAPERPFTTTRFSRSALAAGTAVPDADGIELVSVGRPVPGFALEIRAEDGAPLPARSVGRVWVTGPSLMRGYYDLPDETALVLRGGWLDTGDLGLIHDGELYLTGRAKDMLLLNGRNHPPQTVEQAVAGVPGARSGCAVAASFLPEDGSGEELLLLVEHARATTPEQRAALPGLCAAAVLQATGLRCDHVVVVAPGTLPRTSSGKLRRGEALALWRAGALVAPDPVTPLRVLGAVARAVWQEWRVTRSG